MKKLTKSLFPETTISGEEAASIIRCGGLLNGVAIQGNISLCGLTLPSIKISSCLIFDKIDLEQATVGMLCLSDVFLTELSLCRLKKLMALEIDANTEISILSVSIFGSAQGKKLNNALQTEDWLQLEKHSRAISLDSFNEKISTFLGFYKNVQIN